jgi:hypothetical protein
MMWYHTLVCRTVVSCLLVVSFAWWNSNVFISLTTFVFVETSATSVVLVSDTLGDTKNVGTMLC